MAKLDATIKAEDIRAWLNEMETEYASRHGEKGLLKFVVHGSTIFRIYEKGVLILETTNLFKAVNEYNNRV